jgi:cytochrome c oxidase subunit 2
VLASPLALALVACSGPQSALDPAGEEAAHIANLFWVMLMGGGLIWLFVAAALVYALWPDRKVHDERTAGRFIFWAGAIFPAITLLALLAYALWQMPGLRPFAQPSGQGLRIEITGRQFWWEVIYYPPNGGRVVSANEIRLPVGERVELVLRSGDVIHSFWIPSLAGKMDMIPGRTNRLSVLATRTGSFRGPCAEYCGTSHALMALVAVTMEPPDFRSWLNEQARPSAGTDAAGADLFLKHGCGACHRIAGTEAEGVIAPDLSHVGSRQTIGAGLLPNTPHAITDFIARPHLAKPGQHMPAFEMLDPRELAVLAAYLEGLQ